MSELLQRLRQANHTLSAAIVLLNAPARAGIGITPEQLAGVLSELLRVGEWLQRKAVPQNDPEVAVAVQQYRESLQQLQSLLPALHAQLLTERARLEAERSHLESASAWAGASHNTR
jgi:hypothetical protein